MEPVDDVAVSDDRVDLDESDLLADDNDVVDVGYEPDDDLDAFTIPVPPKRIIHPRNKSSPKRLPGTPRKKRKPNSLPFPFTPDQEKELA